MSITSPLSHILSVLTETQALAQQHKELLRQNAQATQAVLVEPILRALGWNCNDPRYVRRNQIFHDVALDYLLYDDDDKICTLIKVAALGQNLQNEQLLEPLQVFAELQDIDFVILTNGSEWQFLRPGEEGFLEFITALRQQTMPIENIAQRLIGLLDICNFWRYQQPDHLTQLYRLVDQLQSGLNLLRQAELEANPEKNDPLIQTVQLIESSPADQKAEVKPRPPRHKRTLEPDLPDSLVDLESLEFIPLQKLDNIPGKKPQALRLPTGEVIPILSWREVLTTCCNLTLEHNPDLPIPFPDNGGRKTQLINTVPPKEGRSFEQIQSRGRTLYIYTNYDSLHHVQNSIHILEQLPSHLKKVEPALALHDS